MAQRDYVSRGKAPQKKKPENKKHGKSKVKGAPSASFPIVRLAIVVILLIGFAVFLWSIKDNASSEVDTEVVRPVAPTQEALPELPKEEWEYIRTLPGYEVEVDVAEQEKSDKRYLMQCASFRTRAQAEEMKAKMAFMGEEPNIKKVKGSKGTWYQVILGPYDNKRQAEKTRHKMQRANINTCEIFYWT